MTQRLLHSIAVALLLGVAAFAAQSPNVDRELQLRVARTALVMAEATQEALLKEAQNLPLDRSREENLARQEQTARHIEELRALIALLEAEQLAAEAIAEIAPPEIEAPPPEPTEAPTGAEQGIEEALADADDWLQESEEKAANREPAGGGGGGGGDENPSGGGPGEDEGQNGRGDGDRPPQEGDPREAPEPGAQRPPGDHLPGNGRIPPGDRDQGDMGGGEGPDNISAEDQRLIEILEDMKANEPDPEKKRKIQEEIDKIKRGS